MLVVIIKRSAVIISYNSYNVFKYDRNNKIKKKRRRMMKITINPTAIMICYNNFL